MAPTGSQDSQAPATPGAGAYSQVAAPCSGRFVRKFRQIVLWPVQLSPRQGRGHTQADVWDELPSPTGGQESSWREISDPFPRDPSRLEESHYREFETFLPHVHRFLYGHGARESLDGERSPIRVFRRRDVAQARLVLNERADALLFDVARVDLYVFTDVNVAVLAVEIEGRDLAVESAQEVMYRFGRAYPAGWSETGKASYCLERVDWLDRNGRELATSDYERREKFLRSVCRLHAPGIAAHWEFMLRPLVFSNEEAEGPLRCRLVEGNRMPILAYLALDDPHCLTPNDYVRLGLALAPGDPSASPYGPAFLKDFDARYCYDRFHDPTRADGWIDTRIMCCGYAFVTIGDARLPLFTDPERGVLALFRRQIFLLGLIAHFHRATLLMLLDRFVRTINRLEIGRPETLRRFRTELRQTIETFLCFSHRYWFSEVTDQAVPRDLFRMWSEHLTTAPLYDEVSQELQRMNQYLDSVMLRRTSGTILRLTVVAILSLIGTATTGFLGMNLLDATDAPLTYKVLFFCAIAALALTLTVYTIMKARPLADFLDALADDRLSWRAKLTAFLAVWKRDTNGWARWTMGSRLRPPP
jgi:hypothetical protein